MTPPILASMSRPRVRALLVAPVLASLAAGAVAASAGPSATAAARSPETQRCFGAPARDPIKPCRNPALATEVFPTPDDALLYPNAECAPVAQSVPFQCTFGVAPDDARGEIALVGDSHATHWRSALQTVAEDYGWHGTSMTRSGCTFSRAEPVLPGRLKQECLDWRDQVVAWFEAHPEVRTVFLSQHPGEVVVPKGSTRWKTKVRGFRRAWRDLPDTVKHIVIIRDTPYVSTRTPVCIKRAMRRDRDAGRACALPRRRALKRDHAAEAALRFRGRPGVRVIDMTHFMCDEERCYPVVGGALTHKDTGHITLVFGQTLGPFLLRSVRALGIKI